MVFNTTIFLTCIAIFFARIIDVSVGTIRIISIVQGRMKTAFFLGFIEVSIWLFVISTVMGDLKENPILAIFYALGYASGNVVGIKIEKALSLGDGLLRIICFSNGAEVVRKISAMGYKVIVFHGTEKDRPVMEIEIPCRRSEIAPIIELARQVENDLYYVTETISLSPKAKLPVMQRPTGWRAVFKRK